MYLLHNKSTHTYLNYGVFFYWRQITDFDTKIGIWSVFWSFLGMKMKIFRLGPNLKIVGLYYTQVYDKY